MYTRPHFMSICHPVRLPYINLNISIQRQFSYVLERDFHHAAKYIKWGLRMAAAT